MAAGMPGAGAYSDEIPLHATLARDTLTINPNSYLVVRYIAEVAIQGAPAPGGPVGPKSKLCR